MPLATWSETSAYVESKDVVPIVFRNGIALGLPVIPAAHVSGFVEEGEILEIILEEEYTVLNNLTAGTSMTVSPIPKIMRRVLAAGGIYAYLRENVDYNK